MAKEKAGQASDALEEGARQAGDTAQKVAADTSEAIESGAQQVCMLTITQSVRERARRSALSRLWSMS